MSSIVTEVMFSENGSQYKFASLFIVKYAVLIITIIGIAKNKKTLANLLKNAV